MWAFKILKIIFTNFVNTGCLIYPIKQSCFTNFAWSLELREVERMSLHYETWSKAGASPNYYVKSPELYVSNFNWLNNWINEYFFFKFTDFFLGIIFMTLIFFFLFNTKQKKQIKNTTLFFYVYPIIIILLIEWFINHPSLRYGGYSLIALSFFIPSSLVLEQYENKINSIKKKTFIIILITITIFGLRNIDRIIKENKKYDYNVFSNPYYKVDSTYFRIQKKINKITTNYKNCQKGKDECNDNDEFFVKSKNGKYIFVRKKDKF